MRRHLRRLKEKLPADEQTFLGDEDAQDLVLHNLLHAVQGCVDLASRVVSDEGFGQPDNLADLFRLLADNGVLDTALAGRLRQAVGPRNMLVHQYAHLDLSRVYRAARENPRDLEGFLLAMVERFGPGELDA